MKTSGTEHFAGFGDATAHSFQTAGQRARETSVVCVDKL
jgi:hypothetical protein